MDYIFNGKLLLAGVLGWGEAHLEKVIKVKDAYEIHKKPKKSGGTRTISVPHPILRKFQRRFLKYFLYRILDQGWISPRIHGFIPKRSHISNARSHASLFTKNVIRLDIKDAFPSITAEMVKSALWRVLSVEILRYRLIGLSGIKGIRREYPRPPLFSSKKKVKWFRKFFSSNPRPPWLKGIDPYEVLKEFVDTLIPLVIFNGSLPQGAPTSPFLLNLVLSHYEIPEKIFKWFNERGTSVNVTVYADDFTISSFTPFSKEVVSEFMDFMEKDELFRFNRKKTTFFDYRKTAPLVTGLRIVHSLIPVSSMEKVVKIGVPKKKLRKIRGIIHRAITAPELRAKADGYIAYLKGVYGSELPSQVMTPYQRYREVVGKKS